MPIYAYRCESCGHQQDILQKMSAEPLTVCTACGASAFKKQVTAAGFQLKGSGWYVTDFRNNGAAPAAKSSKDDGAGEGKSEAAPAAPASGGDASGSTAPASSPGSSTAPAVAPASGVSSAPASPAAGA